jgi:hypothetical protein
MWAKRLKMLLAIFEVGGGVLSFIAPRRHALTWLCIWPFGPESLRRHARWHADNPTYTRLGAVLGIAFGIWLALREFDD